MQVEYPPQVLLIVQNLWLLGFVVIVFNFFWFWRDAKKILQEEPHKLVGYQRLIFWITLLCLLPVIVLAFGCLFGKLTAFEYFLLKQLNPFVLAFHACILLELVLVSLWITLLKGDQFIQEHPFKKGAQLPSTVLKLSSLIVVLLYFGFLYTLYFEIFPVGDLPIPKK